jgi:hypothetical protein
LTTNFKTIRKRGNSSGYSYIASAAVTARVGTAANLSIRKIVYSSGNCYISITTSTITINRATANERFVEVAASSIDC